MEIPKSFAFSPLGKCQLILSYSTDSHTEFNAFHTKINGLPSLWKGKDKPKRAKKGTMHQFFFLKKIVSDHICSCVYFKNI